MDKIKKRRLMRGVAWTCFVLPYILFILSYTPLVENHVQDGDIKRVEKYLHREMQKATETTQQLLKSPYRIASYNYNVEENVTFSIFKNADLLSWTNDVAVDEATLCAIDTVWQYLKLGSGNYIARSHVRGDYKVVTTILIHTAFPFTNEILVNEYNSRLHFPKKTNVIPISEEVPLGAESHVVSGMKGEPLFILYSLVSNDNYALLFRWLAVLITLISYYLFLQTYYSSYKVAIIISSFIVLRVIIFFLPKVFNGNMKLFSVNIYAESSFLRSLADLFLHAACIFFVFSVIYLMRNSWRRYMQKLKQKKKVQYKIMKAFDIVGIFSFLFFIQYIIRSLVLNSTINMEPFHLSDVSLYTVLGYAILVLLYAGLFILLYLFANNYYYKWLVLHNRYQTFFLFLFVIVLYTLGWIDHYSNKKEKQQTVIWAEKLALEHDPAAEMTFIEAGTLINNDKDLQQLVLQGEKGKIVRLLLDRYFNTYMYRYDMKITICPPGKDTASIYVRRHFDEMIAQIGEQTHRNTEFYFLNNYNGHISYLGVMRFPDDKDQEVILYMEFESKLRPLSDGYPELLLDEEITSNVNIPEIYSYAVYVDWTLIMSHGTYNYDALREINTGTKQFEILNYNKYRHFYVRLNDHNVVMLSRPQRSILVYAATFTYLAVPYAIVIYLLLLSLGWRSYLSVQRNTFRSKITMLLLGVLGVSMLIQGALTVWSSIEQFKKNNLRKMDDKMTTMMLDLDDYLSTYGSFKEEDQRLLWANLNRLSNSLHVDINLYDEAGKLLISSRPEIFEKQLQSRRMDSEAMRIFYRENLTRYMDDASIGAKTYSSMYAPLYNKKGALEGYVNLPYFSQAMETSDGVGTIITAIVNVHILLLILVLLIGFTLSNNISQPLIMIRQNMRQFRISKKLNYIDYKQKDELGDLVYAYNHMIDVIEESSRRIAQNERESAWREMARQIAHEIKNPLTPMRLSIQHLMRMKKDNVPGWQDRFDALATSMLEQIDTMSRTASEFSDFAKSKMEMPVQVELNAVLNEQKSLFDNIPNITFDFTSEVPEAFVVGHRDQLTRVFVNLIANAIQALGDKPDARIRVTIHEAGNFYYIAVEDNGPGVSLAAQRKLFTPNFTTKSSGSGLGLAISKNIIMRKGGIIEYLPSDMGGACFLIKLPKQSL